MKSSTITTIYVLLTIFNLPSIGQNCPVETAPYFENFDGNSFTAGSGSQVPQSVDSCWSRDAISSDYFWQVGPSSSRTENTGPQGDHTTGNGNYMFTEVDGNFSLPLTCNLVTPLIDLDTLTHPKLTFFAHLYGASISSLKVYVNDGGSWNLEHSIMGQQQNKSTDPWVKVSVDLLNYLGDTVQVRFSAERIINNSHRYETEISVDDIRISNDVICEVPQNLSVNFETDIKAGINWVSGGGNSWNVSYGLTGTPPQSGSILNATSTNIILSGLSPSTGYDVYVRDSCGPGQVSTWYGPVSFFTECPPLTAPYHENFDSSNFPLNGSFPPCWKRRTVGSDFYFSAGTGNMGGSSTGPSGDHTTGSGKYVFSRHTGNYFAFKYAEAIFTTPLVDLGNLTKPSLGFWYHMFGVEIDSMAVFIESATGITNVLTVIGQQQFSSTDPWKSVEIDLSAFTGDTISIGFISYKDAGPNSTTAVSIDDISIQEAPACPKPHILRVEKVTGSSVALAWSAATASNWQVKYRPSGSAGAFTFISTTNNPITISGLSPRTEYDFYVQDSCGTTGSGQWVGPVTATTNCQLATIPYYENFDSPEWVPGVNLSNTGNTISSCWTRPDGLAPNFGSMTGATTSSSTGPAYGKGATGNYIYTEASVANYPGTGVITSPKIYVNPLRVNPRLRFAYHMYGADITSLEVEVRSDSGFTNVHTITGQQQTSPTDQWKFQVVSLGQYSGDTIQIRFKGAFSGYRGDIAIDDFSVIAQPCPIAWATFADSAHFLNVSFRADSATALDSLYWDFGDGNDTSFLNPSHKFDTAGAYTVKCFVFNNCGNVDSTIQMITVCDSIVPAFSTTQSGDTLTLDASLTTGGNIYYWDLGNGKDTSGVMIRKPFGTQDSTTIGLTVVNACGDSTTIYQTIKLCQPPESHWGYTIISTTSIGMKVQFDGTSSKNASSYYWDFGDGDTSSSSLSPIHTYSTPSLSYLVSLRVKNACNQMDIKSARLNEIGLDDFKLQTLFSIFPNPASESVTLAWPVEETTIEKIHIINISGKIMAAKQVGESAEGKIQIGLSQIPKGFCIFRIYTNRGAVDKFIVIE